MSRFTEWFHYNRFKISFDTIRSVHVGKNCFIVEMKDGSEKPFGLYSNLRRMEKDIDKILKILYPEK